MNVLDIVSVKGAIDLHIHSAPCLFPRIADDLEMAAEAKRLGMRAIALKSPFESTVGRAYHAARQIGFPVYGGLVLNHWTGGINPGAVLKTLKMGGKLIWLPTFDAEQHAKVYGGTGRYKERSMRVQSVTDKGISILKDGELIDKAKTVVEMVKEYGGILGTGHVSGGEIKALVQHAARIGGVKITITHPDWPAPGVDIEFLREMVKLGAIAEFCASSIGPLTYYLPPTKLKEYIDILGAKNIILSSDCGVAFYPMPMEFLRVLASCLYESGVSAEDLQVMMIQNPKKLLGLDE
jgi:hypothetical protein